MSVNPEKYFPKTLLPTHAKVGQVYQNNLNPNNQKVSVEIVSNEGMKNCLEFLNKEGNSSQWKNNLFNLKIIILILSLYGLLNQYSLICCSHSGNVNNPQQHSAQGLLLSTTHQSNKSDLFWEFMEKYEILRSNIKNNATIMPEET
jgi:hypothetical protein